MNRVSGLQLPQPQQTHQTCLCAVRLFPQNLTSHSLLRGVKTKSAKPSFASFSLSAKSDQLLLESLIHQTEKSDGGAALSTEAQSEVNDLILELGSRGERQQPRPLDNPAVFGNYIVAYSSTERSSGQNRQPAGGIFRSQLSRRLVKTTKLCQSILRPDWANNKVEFLLLGSIQCSVSLRGRFEPVEEDQATVKVNFEPPRLTIGRHVDLPIGGTSSVTLKTTYLTDSVRLGQGSRGSLFVFTKGGYADSAGMDRVGLGKTTPVGWLGLVGASVLFLLAAVRLWRISVIGKILATLPTLLAALLSWSGGVELFSGKKRYQTP